MLAALGRHPSPMTDKQVSCKHFPAHQDKCGGEAEPPARRRAPGCRRTAQEQQHSSAGCLPHARAESTSRTENIQPRPSVLRAWPRCPNSSLGPRSRSQRSLLRRSPSSAGWSLQPAHGAGTAIPAPSHSTNCTL